MSTLTLHRMPIVPVRSLAVVIASAAAVVLLASSLGGVPAQPVAPATSADAPPVVVSSPMIAVGLPVDSVVGGASPVISATGPVDHATAVSETAESWPARPTSGTTAPSPTAAPVVPAPVDNQASLHGSDEVGLIPAAIAWRDADGEVHQGLIGVDDIPAEVLGQPEGVFAGD